MGEFTLAWKTRTWVGGRIISDLAPKKTAPWSNFKICKSIKTDHPLPRPRKSYDDAKMTGAVAVNKGRFEGRKKSPRTTGKIGTPPKHLTEPQKAVWKEIAKAIPTGVAGASDRLTVELAAVLLAQFREAPLTMQASRVALVMQLLSRLGLDPQARTRLQVEPQPEEKTEDEWSTLTTTPAARRSTRVM